MRPLYLYLWLTLPYMLRVFYRRTKVLNTQKNFKAQTIFVCNHPSAFIDPLIIANFHNPIIHFMTRSDVFKPWLKPVTWACHMVPIYRTAEDGSDSAEKNLASFKDAIGILQKKRSLIMFGEGYTDDVFIRSLKTMKKGPARIAFGAMEATNWKEDIKVQTIGVNYSDPTSFNCDLLLSAGPIIHLKDFQKTYEENPNKAATQLTRELDKNLKDQITYVKDKALAPFVDQIMAITRKGMNHWHRDTRISLVKRWENSKATAQRVNDHYKAEDAQWTGLKSELENYFNDQKKEKVNENWVYQYSKSQNKNLLLRLLFLILLSPVFVLGFAHNFLAYILVKKLVEKMFRRKVFWSGVKLLLGTTIDFILNLPVIWLFYEFVYPSYWFGLAYFLTVPAISGVIAYNYALKFMDTVRITSVKKDILEKFATRRKKIAEQLAVLGF